MHGLVAARRVGGRLALAEYQPEPVGLDVVRRQAGLTDGLTCRDEGQLGGAVQVRVGVRELLGDPPGGDLARVPGGEHGERLVVDRGDTTLAGHEPQPELCRVPADGADDTQTGDDDGARRHAYSFSGDRPIR
ncbi:hypothetical protein GCM10018952_27450 [Streptosporangium vulgare]